MFKRWNRVGNHTGRDGLLALVDVIQDAITKSAEGDLSQIEVPNRLSLWLQPLWW